MDKVRDKERKTGRENGRCKERQIGAEKEGKHGR
jgi:hypothetical protein